MESQPVSSLQNSIVNDRSGLDLTARAIPILYILHYSIVFKTQAEYNPIPGVCHNYSRFLFCFVGIFTYLKYCTVHYPVLRICYTGLSSRQTTSLDLGTDDKFLYNTLHL